MTTSVTITVALQQDDVGYPPWSEETLYAEHVTAGTYRLVSVPTFARNLARNDLVETVTFEGALYAVRIVGWGGHSTLRVILFDSGCHDELLSFAESYGCTVEHTAIPNLFAIDVPPRGDLPQCRAALLAGEDAGKWSYDEGCVATQERVQESPPSA